MRVIKKTQTLTLFSKSSQAPGTGFVGGGALAVPLFVFCCCGLFAILCPAVLQPRGLWPSRLLCPWNFPDMNTGVGCHFLLQGIFPNQVSNWSLLHQQADSWPLSHQGSHLFNFTSLQNGSQGGKSLCDQCQSRGAERRCGKCQRKRCSFWFGCRGRFPKGNSPGFPWIRGLGRFHSWKIFCEGMTRVCLEDSSRITLLAI